MNSMVAASMACLVVLALFFISFYSLYAGLIKKKNKVSEASSGVDVQLKKRYDLIPNILKIASKFMEHEKSLMEEITNLRTKAMGLSNGLDDFDEKIKLNNEINAKMGQIMVAVENYPQLKSDQTMVIAMQSYNEVEEHIAAARRFYNSAVLELNNATEIFPSSIVAAMLGIKPREFFQVSEAEKSSISAGDYLK